jgi:hypothetical protein
MLYYTGTTRTGAAESRRERGRPQTASSSQQVSWQVPSNAAPAPATNTVSTWTIMLAIWPVEERPDEMRRPEIVNSLSFDQMVTYKKLYDARMKKEGKGEEVFGRDCPIPPTMFEAAADDCAEQLHPAR